MEFTLDPQSQMGSFGRESSNQQQKQGVLPISTGTGQACLQSVL